MTTPIFILSLPRSGSTLLQRALLLSGECETLGEPSLLLRFLGDATHVSRFSSYRESNIEISMRDIRKKWSGFDDFYYSSVNQFMSELYTNLAEGKRYFVDKTPRYTLIAEEIMHTFHSAKFIVLWRHPLAIASSIVSTFFKDKWYFEDFSVDLSLGLDRLYEFEQAYSNSICSIRYEDLVTKPTTTLKKIGRYLEIELLEDIAESELPRSTGGTLGDPTGVEKFTTISSDSLDRWIKSYKNWYRQRWAKTFYKNPRAKWLKEKGYNLPKEIVTAGVFANLLNGYREQTCVNRKNRRRNRRMIRAMYKGHISPHSYAPNKE